MPTASSLREQPKSTRRVLVVEDNLDAVHSMARLIKLMGHECQFAINGFAAFEIARRFRPDLVLLDIGLPDFTGCEIVRLLKQESAFENTRFVAISALPEHQYRQAALDAGCAEFYRKPIEMSVLQALCDR